MPKKKAKPIPTADSLEILEAPQHIISQTEKDSITTPAPPSLLPGVFRLNDRNVTFSGSAMYALSKARTVGKVNDTQDTITIGDITIESKNASVLGGGEDKLFWYGVAAFTTINAQNAKAPKLRIFGDTKAFARDQKKPIDPRPMETPEEQKKENRRAEKALENFIAKLSKNADNLMSNAAFKFTEKDKGVVKSYSSLSFISAYHIDSEIIMLEFGQTAAEYLVRRPLSNMPRGYYGIDERKPNALAIANALIRHYGINKNVVRNTERMLKIETLLSYTSYPSIETIKEKRWSWERLVKEPFEQALDELTNNLIKTWEYRLANKTPLTDEQAQNITTYGQFVSLYLYYELTGYDSHEERAKAIEERTKQNIAKRKAKGKTTKAKGKPEKDAGPNA